jgi:biotin/methionine sulfoxide reductase
MAATLAAMLGQIGLPGGGVGFGYGAIGGIGSPIRRLDGLSLAQGTNPVKRFIPVARIADMLLGPGEPFDFNGRRLEYPDIKLVYWCGGNPFHHHQDLNRLREAWQRPETVIVHEPWWTATAKHADIVLPATTTLERNDIGRAGSDAFLIAMPRMVSPVGDARSDYEMFSGLARRLGIWDAFTEGRDEGEWLEHLYSRFRQKLSEDGLTLPGFEEFWAAGHIELPVTGHAHMAVPFAAFRDDPGANPLATPSGRIEIFSETIAGFGYDDCPGHPTWMEPGEWLGADETARHPLHLLSPQPATRLHSQLDCGKTSRDAKLRDREVMLMNPDDAQARGIEDGDMVRLFNDRGACLAGARLSPDVRPGVVALPTGAWFDPQDDGDPVVPLERHGNPNALTLDKGTSRLAQGASAHSALVEVERFDAEAPTVLAHEPPPILVARGAG